MQAASCEPMVWVRQRVGIMPARPAGRVRDLDVDGKRRDVGAAVDGDLDLDHWVLFNIARPERSAKPL
jgi:hypothetical protein